MIFAALMERRGLAHSGEVFSILANSIGEVPVRMCLLLVFCVGFIYTASIRQPKTSKFRLNRRYIVSAIAGFLLPFILAAIVVTLSDSPLLSQVRLDFRRELGQLIFLTAMAVLFLTARRFVSEIEPGLGFCEHCGDDLRFLDTKQCPKCSRPTGEPVPANAIRKESDVAQLDRCPFAIVYLIYPGDPLEERTWIWFVRNVRKHVQKFPTATFYFTDISPHWVQRWLESPSRGAKIAEIDRVAFVERGEIRESAPRLLADYYFRHGPQSITGLEDRVTDQHAATQTFAEFF